MEALTDIIQHGLVLLVSLLLSASTVGCSVSGLTGIPPAPPATQAVYPTIEEAALASLRFEWRHDVMDGSPPPDLTSYDIAATLKLLAEKSRWTAVDLNGDGMDEVLFANVIWVDKAGKEIGGGGGASNDASWAVLQKVPKGWRVVAAGSGWICPPDVKPETTNGWHDLETTYHGSIAEGSTELFQFDGARYRFTKSTEYRPGLFPLAIDRPAVAQPGAQPAMSDFAKKFSAAMPAGWKLTGHNWCEAPARWSPDAAMGESGCEYLDFKHDTSKAHWIPGPSRFRAWITPADYVGRMLARNPAGAMLYRSSKERLLFIEGDWADDENWAQVEKVASALFNQGVGDWSITPAAEKTARNAAPLPAK